MFSASVKPELPEKETYLYRDSYPVDDKYPNFGTMPVVIPAGVTVIKFALGGNASQGDEPCTCLAVNATTGTTWVDAGGYGAVGEIVYVGVTPGKAYDIGYSVDAELDIISYSCVIMYSKEINTHTPYVKDY